ncbi:MAG: ribonuclease HII [Oscillospiraceae bacterium]|jgi:ribonuclease HII|nr:ribonuclease HII [Oscillospiraceae bacterium]
MNDLWIYEQQYTENGSLTVAGVDEAGRGPLAGPVFAAAVILPFGTEIDGLNDSKKLSEAKREKLFDIITDKAVAYGIASASEKEIDGINILEATFLAMNRALKQIEGSFDLALIDGNRNKGIEYPSVTVIKGDALCADIAAASILAKVSRDRFMYTMAEKYPQYGFEKHKGYGTKLHYENIAKYGVCPIHRKTFLKGIV